jgi:hypothetical protein
MSMKIIQEKIENVKLNLKKVKKINIVIRKIEILVKETNLIVCCKDRDSLQFSLEKSKGRLPRSLHSLAMTDESGTVTLKNGRADCRGRCTPSQ